MEKVDFVELRVVETSQKLFFFMGGRKINPTRAGLSLFLWNLLPKRIGSKIEDYNISAPSHHSQKK